MEILLIVSFLVVFFLGHLSGVNAVWWAIGQRIKQGCEPYIVIDKEGAKLSWK